MDEQHAPTPADGAAAEPPVGMLVLDKPVGMSSMKAVAIVRRRASQGSRARTGHAGTLDPLASGVLVIAIGRTATREIDRFMTTEKAYETVIDLSAFTATDDTEGEREEVAVAAPPDAAAVRAAVARFRGTFEQRPPAFSAVKVDGKRAYRLARAGKDPELPPRTVTVHEIEMRGYAWPRAEVALRCAKGFYVRSLARALGEALGTGGHCLSIRRTAVGPFTLDEAIALDDVPDPLRARDLIPVPEALRRLPDSAPDPTAPADRGCG